MKRILQYLQVTKDKGLVINPSNKMGVDCYAGADFAGVWVHENLQYLIFDISRNLFMIMIDNCNLFWVSKIQTKFSLSTLQYEHVVLSHSVR